MQDTISTRISTVGPTTEYSSSISAGAAKVSLAAVLAFLVLLSALHVIKPELDPSWRLVSEYAIGAFGWIMQLAFGSLALSLVSLLFAIRTELRTVIGRIGMGLGFVAALSMVAAAIFSIDPITASPDELTTHGSLHGIAATAGNPSFVLATLLISLSLVREPAWSPQRRLLLWTGNLPWLCFVFMLAVLGITLSQAGAFGPEVPVGWPNRLLVIAYSAWLSAVARHALRLSIDEL